MNLPTVAAPTGIEAGLDDHMEESRLAQRQADKWLISGSILIGTAALGIFGLPLFLRGVWLLRKAQRDGLVGSAHACHAARVSGHHRRRHQHGRLGARPGGQPHPVWPACFLTGWGNMFDAGYFWHFNELWIGGAAGPGEKGWEIGLIFTVFTMRIAAAIGFLQMKRWGHQWMIITCWMGVVIWCGYVFNMTMYADVRFAGVVLPVDRLVALRHLLHHPVPRHPVSALGQPRDLL